MKKLYAALAFVSILLVTDIGLNLAHPRIIVQAQSTPVGFILANPATSVSGCAWPTFVPTGTINAIAVCPVNTGTAATSGISLAMNSGAFGSVFPVGGPSSGAAITIAATAPITATTNGSTVTIALPSAGLKTAVDALGLTAAAAPVQ
jgi:hypothetical protein